VSTLAVNELQLAPLGAGDLIDRTVRLYRHHFAPLLRASAPPIIVQTVGVVLWTIGVQAAAATGAEEWLVVYFLLAVFALVLWFAGFMFQLIVLGGATRNLVMHLLRGEPVTARAVYRNVRSRFWGLLGATIAMMLCAGFAAGLAFFLWFVLIMLSAVFVAVASGSAAGAWLGGLLFLLVNIAAAVGALYVFFLLAGRVAYVPQVMMVEGKGVFASIGRSTELARGNVRRLMAMFLFTTFATYSVLMILLVPLGWFSWLNGVDLWALLLGTDPERVPAWAAVSYQVALQLSGIILAPVWMLGLSLLYVDERVRHEGYDVELLAAQRLGEMPALPAGANVPLVPAIVTPVAAPVAAPRPAVDEDYIQANKRAGSVLGL
jgi:hypothetical protein